MTKIRYIPIFIAFIMMSCNTSPKKLSSSDIFFRYLKEVHSISKEKAAKFYIILPHIGCKGCMDRALPDLAKMIKTLPDSKDFVFIIANDRFSNLPALKGLNVLNDFEDKISGKAIKISGISIFKIEKDHTLKSFYIQDEIFDHNELKTFIGS